MSNKNVIFKCFSGGDEPQNMLFVDRKQIKKIYPKTTKDGRSVLFIDYYDDEFCFDTTFICDEIVTIDTDIDEDYKIWKQY